LRFIAAIRSLSYRGIIRNLKGHFEPFYKSQHRVSPEITLMYGIEDTRANIRTAHFRVVMAQA